MKLKGVKKLNKKMSEIFSGFGISEVKLSDCYAYYTNSECITFQIVDREENDWFMEFIEERFGYKVEYPFIMSMLHEVGHHMTLDDLGEYTYRFCEEEKDDIEHVLSYSRDEEEQRIYEWRYYNLPDEIIATDWAVKYAMAHPRAIKRMNDKVMKSLAEFYEVNMVEVD